MRMEQVRTLNIRGTREMFQAAMLGREVDDGLVEPLHAIASELVVRAEKKSASVYICSADTDNDLRNYFAFAVARAIKSRLRDVVVVDCDFLSVGLSNVVPERDALGFLDLLLYGSSLDVITQRTSDGINVIGAGSFPVSRKSPFVMDAFDEAVRYLSNHARCVIFCGPVFDDDGDTNPILGGVQLRVLVRSGKPQRPNSLDAVEEKVAALGGETWMVRVAEAGRPIVRQKEDVQEQVSEPGGGVTARGTSESAVEAPSARDAQDVTQAAAGVAGERPAPSATVPRPGATGAPPPASELDEEPPPAWDEVREVQIDRRSGNSIFPRLIIGTLSILLIGFMAWWLYLTRSIRDQIDAPIDMTQVEAPDDRGAGLPAAEKAGDTGGQPRADVQGVPGVSVEPEVSAPAPGDASVAPKLSEPAAGDAAAAPKLSEPVADDAAAAPQTSEPVASERIAGTQGSATQPAATPAAAPSVSLGEQLSGYAGEYLIHVSSFRGRDHAQSDADYLEGRGYSTVIARVDLGEKGLWYRVYVGPFTTSAEAQTMKIRLDENPRVRSTRITKVPR